MGYLNELRELEGCGLTARQAEEVWLAEKHSEIDREKKNKKKVVRQSVESQIDSAYKRIEEGAIIQSNKVIVLLKINEKKPIKKDYAINTKPGMTYEEVGAKAFKKYQKIHNSYHNTGIDETLTYEIIGIWHRE